MDEETKKRRVLDQNNASRRKLYKFQQVCLHKEYDKDILDKLESVENKQGYIKQLIRNDIKKDMEQS